LDSLGQYSLDEKVGEGAMGEVYRASHALLRRPTAVKLLRPGRSAERAIGRFEREVQYTSRLTHPNTIAIYDYGRTPEGLFYYAMEYLEGLTLHDIVATDGPQPEGRVIHILRQTCGSLQEAHDAGLIHRDIKAANIMVCNRGGIPDFVKVLDFGLVKSVEPVSVSLTMPGSLTGTPLYMSPEAIDTTDQLDGRSDLYAVGVLGYYALTGRYVFEGGTAMDICHRHQYQEPEPPSRHLESPISPELESVILKCLAKDRNDRPNSARHLADALAACPAAKTWTEDDARQWWAERSS
jgi:serine/threonine protein kinase